MATDARSRQERRLGELLRASALIASGGNFERRFNGREGKSLEIYAS